MQYNSLFVSQSDKTATILSYSNNNNTSGVVDNRSTGTGRFADYDGVLREFHEKGSLPTNRNFDNEQQRIDMKNEAEAAVAIQSAFKGYQARKEIN